MVLHQRCLDVTVQGIERNWYGHPDTWTFGAAEDNYIDLGKLVREAWDDPWTQAELMSIQDAASRS